MKISEKVKESLKELFTIVSEVEKKEEKEEKKFIEAKTKEGVTVVYEALEVGANVNVIDAEGNEIPAPDGEHALEDGNVISVEDGKIVAIVTVEEAETKDKTEATENQFNAINKKFKALETKIASLETINEKYKAKFANQTKIVEKFMEVVDELGKESKQVEVVKTSFTKSADEKLNKIRQLSQLINK
jgi:DNA repair ATPase RecN